MCCTFNGLLHQQVAISVFQDDLLDDLIVVPLKRQLYAAESADDLPLITLE